MNKNWNKGLVFNKILQETLLEEYGVYSDFVIIFYDNQKIKKEIEKYEKTNLYKRDIKDLCHFIINSNGISNTDKDTLIELTFKYCVIKKLKKSDADVSLLQQELMGGSSSEHIMPNIVELKENLNKFREDNKYCIDSGIETLTDFYNYVFNNFKDDKIIENLTKKFRNKPWYLTSILDDFKETQELKGLGNFEKNAEYYIFLGKKIVDLLTTENKITIDASVNWPESNQNKTYTTDFVASILWTIFESFLPFVEVFVKEFDETEDNHVDKINKIINVIKNLEEEHYKDDNKVKEVFDKIKQAKEPKEEQKLFKTYKTQIRNWFRKNWVKIKPWLNSFVINATTTALIEGTQNLIKNK